MLRAANTDPQTVNEKLTWNEQSECKKKEERNKASIDMNLSFANYTFLAILPITLVISAAAAAAHSISLNVCAVHAYRYKHNR